jgi:hypothetical protein
VWWIRDFRGQSLRLQSFGREVIAGAVASRPVPMDDPGPHINDRFGLFIFTDFRTQTSHMISFITGCLVRRQQRIYVTTDICTPEACYTKHST